MDFRLGKNLHRSLKKGTTTDGITLQVAASKEKKRFLSDRRSKEGEKEGRELVAQLRSVWC
jgi:hypothetical protein